MTGLLAKAEFLTLFDDVLLRDEDRREVGRDGDLVFLARSAWDVGYQQEKNPELTFSATKER